jgi:c-di-GMP-binding flagellar brake protein YcgR
MSIQHEQRKSPRLNVISQDYGIRFQVKGAEAQDSRLVNLSEGGCGLEVPMALARLLELGDTLEALYLDHPDLPLVPLSAVVLRMLGKVPGKTSGYVLMGVEFQEITPFITGLLGEHVKTRLAAE